MSSTRRFSSLTLICLYLLFSDLLNFFLPSFAPHRIVSYRICRFIVSCFSYPFSLCDILFCYFVGLTSPIRASSSTSGLVLRLCSYRGCWRLGFILSSSCPLLSYCPLYRLTFCCSTYSSNPNLLSVVPFLICFPVILLLILGVVLVFLLYPSLFSLF